MNKLQARQHVRNMTKLRAAITHMLKSNPEKVKAYQAGDTAVLEFFVQQVTKETHATPKIVKQMLIERIK
jgi:Asp-tRNA(Asn)/Glu-tRNA(Gln) amidotransferase B subunit